MHCPQKVEKTTLKSCSEFLKSTFFPLLPAQPKWPKQKKSCSKMWPIDQLHIELGSNPNITLLIIFRFDYLLPLFVDRYGYV